MPNAEVWYLWGRAPTLFEQLELSPYFKLTEVVQASVTSNIPEPIQINSPRLLHIPQIYVLRPSEPHLRQITHVMSMLLLSETDLLDPCPRLLRPLESKPGDIRRCKHIARIMQSINSHTSRSYSPGGQHRSPLPSTTLPPPPSLVLLPATAPVSTPLLLPLHRRLCNSQLLHKTLLRTRPSPPSSPQFRPPRQRRNRPTSFRHRRHPPRHG
jgi:hypothetical protein